MTTGPERGPAPHRQRGIALVILLVAAGVLAAVMVGNFLRSRELREATDRQTQAALGQAKRALLAYAIADMDGTYPDSGGTTDTPGHLPCPALETLSTVNDEGNQMLNCGAKNTTVVGRLPWKTLGTGPLKDGSGECLWYVVSGRHKNDPRGDVVNWDTAGQIRVLNPNGQTLGDDVVAAVIAPGPVLGSQSRSNADPDHNKVCGGNFTGSNYLEADADIGASNHTMTVNVDNRFPLTSTLVQGGRKGASRDEAVNDRIAYLTAGEIRSAMAARKDLDLDADSVANPGRLRALTKFLAECLASYTSLPWPGPLTLVGNNIVDSGADTTENVLQLAGRVPSRLAASSGNILAGCAGYDAVKHTWSHWRDHFFYVIASNVVSPPARTNPIVACSDSNPASHCLAITDGATTTGFIYAGIVIFAGPRIGSQFRRMYPDPNVPLGVEDRQNLANYLESVNATNLAPGTAPVYSPAAQGPSPSDSSLRIFRKGTPGSATVNDILYCIKSDRTVVPC